MYALGSPGKTSQIMYCIFVCELWLSEYSHLQHERIWYMFILHIFIWYACMFIWQCNTGERETFDSNVRNKMSSDISKMSRNISCKRKFCLSLVGRAKGWGKECKLYCMVTLWQCNVCMHVYVYVCVYVCVYACMHVWMLEFMTVYSVYSLWVSDYASRCIHLWVVSLKRCYINPWMNEKMNTCTYDCP